MNKIRLFIYPKQNKKWCSFDGITPVEIPANQLTYGITQSFALDETLDSAVIQIIRSTESAAIEPFTICRLEYSVNNIVNKFYYCIYQDIVELTNKIYNTYTHTLTLIEPTKILERYLLPNNITFTKQASRKYTIQNAIDRLINASVNVPMLETKKLFTFTQNSKYDITSPDFTFSGRNLFEALSEIGRYIGGIPKLVLNAELKPPFNIYYTFPQGEARLNHLLDTSETLEPEKYTDGFRSDIINMVAKDENSSTIIFPSVNSIGFARSKLGEVLKSDTMQLSLPAPIYHIDKAYLYIKMPATWKSGVPAVYVNIKKADGTYVSVWKKIKGRVLTGDNDNIYLETNITNGFAEKNVYSVLPISHDITDINAERFKPSDMGKYQDTTLPWEMENTFIDLSSETTYHNWFGNKYTRSISLNLFILALLNYITDAEVKSLVPDAVEITRMPELYYTSKMDEDIIVNTSGSVIGSPYSLSNLDTPDNFGYNIAYTPFINGTINIAKEAGHQRLPSNQEASIVDASAWGRNQEAALVKTSLPTQEKIIKWKEMPSAIAGKKTPEGYYIVREDRTINPFTIDSKYTLTKGYNRISQFTAIDSKWRQSSIATSQIVTRDYETNDYIYMDTSNEGNAEDKKFSNISGYNAIVSTLQGSSSLPRIGAAAISLNSYFTNDIKLIMPVLATTVGSTIRLAIEFPDNVTAGLTQYTETVENKAVTISRGVPYTREGRSYAFAIQLGSGIEGSADQLKKLPQGENITLTYPAEFRSPGYYQWMKDSREKMRIIHNIHCLRNKIGGFTEYFAKYHEWVTDKNNTHNLTWIKTASPITINQIKATGTEATATYNYLDDGLSITFPEDGYYALIDTDGNIVAYANQKLTYVRLKGEQII